MEALLKRFMGRGRKASASDERILLELSLHPDRAVFTAEIAEQLPIDKERVRQKMEEFSEKQGWVQIDDVSGRNLYRMTSEGHEHLSTVLRDELD